MRCRSTDREHCTVVFIKSPDRGRVKTRLARDVGEQVAVELYQRFVIDIIETVGNSSCGLRLFFHPPEKKEKLVTLLGEKFTYVPQEGENLGERMANAFTLLFGDGFGRVVLIGSDSPDLPGRYIEEAFIALGKNEAVIGPALDGGYFLIGFNREAFTRRVFENMPWSSDDLFEKTKRVFVGLGLTYHTLGYWLDIDTLDDLRLFMENTAKKVSMAPSTVQYISENMNLLPPG